MAPYADDDVLVIGVFLPSWLYDEAVGDTTAPPLPPPPPPLTMRFSGAL
jgi:hypothetical protein